jgi:hypothetical protein
MLAAAASRHQKRTKVITARVLVGVLLAVDVVSLGLLGPQIGDAVNAFQFPCNDAPAFFALLSRTALVTLALAFGYRLSITAHFACTFTGIGYLASQLVEVVRNSALECPPQRPPLEHVPFVAVLAWCIATGSLQILGIALLARYKAAVWPRKSARQPRVGNKQTIRRTSRVVGSDSSASLTTKLLEEHVAAMDSDDVLGMMQFAPSA